MLNAIFYVLVEGVRWRSLPGDFSVWQTVYTYFRNWRNDGTWLKIHDQVREWSRIERERHPSPRASLRQGRTEAIIDSSKCENRSDAGRLCRL